MVACILLFWINCILLSEHTLNGKTDRRKCIKHSFIRKEEYEKNRLDEISAVRRRRQITSTSRCPSLNFKAIKFFFIATNIHVCTSSLLDEQNIQYRTTMGRRTYRPLKYVKGVIKRNCLKLMHIFRKVHTIVA